MASNPASKACINCAKARRKCGKQRPQCLRCHTRGLGCNYAPAKRTCFVPLQDDDSRAIVPIEPIQMITSPLDFSLPFVDDALASWWFASPETWTIDAAPRELTTNVTRFSSIDLSRALRRVIDWLSQWVETGSNPFMHMELWRDCFPQPIQGAYMAMSAYLHKTPLNAHIVNRVIEEKVTRLVAQGLKAESSATSNTLDNLARVQALLVYQCIGLYDGDVRLKHLAERHIPVLEAWVVILMQQASRFLSSGSPVFAVPEAQLAKTVPPHNQLWYSWILAESVRRSWLVTAGIQGIYKLLVLNPGSAASAPCMGGTIFTSRKGFWEASSAEAWEKACSERYAGLVRLTETEKLFEMVPREEISDFAKLALGCTYGTDWCDMWGV
jgi:hypothetical protein